MRVRVTRSALEGQYIIACEEFVSDFVKELIVRMGFFNQKQEGRKALAILKWLYFSGLAQNYLRNLYVALRTFSVVSR